MHLEGYEVPVGATLEPDDAVLPVYILEGARLSIVAGADYHDGIALTKSWRIVERVRA